MLNPVNNIPYVLPDFEMSLFKLTTCEWSDQYSSYANAVQSSLRCVCYEHVPQPVFLPLKQLLKSACSSMLSPAILQVGGVWMNMYSMLCVDMHLYTVEGRYFNF